LNKAGGEKKGRKGKEDEKSKGSKTASARLCVKTKLPREKEIGRVLTERDATGGGGRGKKVNRLKLGSKWGKKRAYS